MLKLTNFASTKLATPPSGTTGLSFTVTAGAGALFPTLTAGDWCYVVLKNATLTREVVRVTARSTDSFTIGAGGRGLDGSTAYANWSAGDVVELCLTNLALQDVLADSGRWAVAGGTADAITATYTPSIYALVDGQLCFVRAGASNTTGTPNFAPNGLTPHTITLAGGAALIAGSISGAGHELILRYNLANTRWELLNPKVVPLTYAQLNAAISDADVALLAGSASQFFACGTATNVAHAVNVDSLQNMSYLSLTTTGSSTAYTGSLSPPSSSNVNEMQIFVTFHTVFGTTPTFALDGHAALPIKYYDTVTGTMLAVTPAQFPGTNLSRLRCSGVSTYWLLLDPAATPAWLTTNGIVAYNSSQTLDTSHKGKYTYLWGTGAITLTLPVASTFAVGELLMIANSQQTGAGTTTLARAGSDVISMRGISETGFNFAQGDTVILASNGSGQWLEVTGSHSPFAQTTANVISANNVQTIAHGLGRLPASIQSCLVVTTANNNWSVGDEIYTTDMSVGGTGNSVLTVGADATNIIVACSAANIVILNKTTAAIAAPVVGSFKVRVKVS